MLDINVVLIPRVGIIYAARETAAYKMIHSYRRSQQPTSNANQCT